MNSPHQPLNSHPFDDQLKAYIDGELPLFKRFQVRAHLSHCHQCREELKLMETLKQELSGEEMPPLATDLRDKILQSAPAQTPQLPKVPVRKPEPVVHRKKSRPILEYGLALGLCFFVGITVLSITGNRIRNTFNSAANAISDDDDFSSSSSTGAAAPAPSISVRRGEDYKLRADEATKNPFPITSPAAGVLAGTAAEPMRSVHKEGSLTVAVENAESTGVSVENLVKRVGGFVANNELSTNSNGLKTSTLDLRVPVAQFESVVAGIGRMGTVKAKNFSGEDVTAKVAVAGARKETLSEQLAIAEAQMRQIAKSHKANSEEMYRARAEVRGLSLQAAQAKAELNTMKKYAALSSLFVTLQDKTKPVAPASFTGSISQTGTEAWNSFVSTAKYPIQLVIWILAYSPLWVPALILWRRFGRKVVLGE